MSTLRHCLVTVVSTLTLAASILSCTTSGAASAARSDDVPPSDFLGVNAQLLWRTDPSADLDALARAGIRWVRADFAWAALEPAQGVHRWGAADRLMAAAAASGVQVLAIVNYSAPWASSDPDGDTLYPPRSAGEFAGFARNVAERYGKGGSFWQNNPDVPALPLAAMEIWNEPWGNWNWKSGPDVRAYARLVRAVSEAVRAVQPEIHLLASGDLLTYEEDADEGPWLEPLLEVDPDIHGAIDGWSIHPYPDPPSLRPWDTDSDPDYTFLGRLQQIRSILLERGAQKPLWITEIGWCTGGPPCGSGGEVEQRDNLVWALEHLHALWPSEVAHVFVFTWEKRVLASPDWAERFGLRREDGSFTSSWHAMLRFTRS